MGKTQVDDAERARVKAAQAFTRQRRLDEWTHTALYALLRTESMPIADHARIAYELAYAMEAERERRIKEGK